MKKKLVIRKVQIKEALKNVKGELLSRTKQALNSEGGFGVIEVIIFACIVILAIISIRPQIFGAFGDTATSWRTWLAQRLLDVFS